MRSNNVLFRFVLRLEYNRLESFPYESGPIFNKFLPNGKQHLIPIDTGQTDVSLKIWFNRRGTTDSSGFIHYNLNKRNVNPDSIKRQGKLYAGSLFGELSYKNIPNTQYNSLMKNSVGLKPYIVLGKKIAKLLYSNISSVIKIFQIQYGQYWIPNINKWDSREQSLGNYFNSQLSVKYSLDKGDSWQTFEPTDQVIMINSHVLSEKVYEMYITKDDFRKIKFLIKKNYKPSFAAEVLIKAHKLYDEGNQRWGLVEIITALELAINEYIDSKINLSTKLKKSLSSLRSLPLPSQVSTLCLGLINLTNDKIEETLQAIDSRNKIVHEGWVPSNVDTIKKQFNSVVNTIKELISNPDIKLPTLHSGNMLKAPSR